jgi:hypothetical protein
MPVPAEELLDILMRGIRPTESVTEMSSIIQSAGSTERKTAAESVGSGRLLPQLMKLTWFITPVDDTGVLMVDRDSIVRMVRRVRLKLHPEGQSRREPVDAKPFLTSKSRMVMVNEREFSWNSRSIVVSSLFSGKSRRGQKTARGEKGDHILSGSKGSYELR